MDEICHVAAPFQLALRHNAVRDGQLKSFIAKELTIAAALFAQNGRYAIPKPGEC
jgi:hypothetical protein